MKKAEVREAYDRFSPWFDLVEGIPDALGLRRLRRRLFERARGRVLEVGFGTGRNVPHFPRGCRVVGADLSLGMLRRARRKFGRPARRLGRDRRGAPAGNGGEGPPPLLALMDAERLAFAAASFDTVVDSLVLCTYPDPVGALAEMARVCRPGGRILLLEHGRSRVGWIAEMQDRREHLLADRVGCHWNRDPRRLVEEAGLPVREAERTVLGVFHLIEAAPPGSEAVGGPAEAAGREDR